MRRFDGWFFFALVCFTGAFGATIYLASGQMMAPAIFGMLLMNIVVVAWAGLKEITDAWEQPDDPRWEHRR